MNDTITLLCEQFIENRNTLKSTIGWESEYIYPICACIFLKQGKKVEAEKLKHCEKLLKSHTGAFSDFRGNGRLAMISMLALSEHPERTLDATLKLYGMLKKQGISSQSLSLTAITLANRTAPEQYEEMVKRTGQMYAQMKKEHPFLTSGEDSVFAALLAASNRSQEEILEEMEQCYKILKNKFSSGNAVQSVSHILTLAEGTAEDKCEKIRKLYDELAKKGYPFGKEYELSVLAVLALQREDFSSTIEDIKQADGLLAGKSGYGMFGLGKKQRLMHAGMIASYVDSSKKENPALNPAAINGTVSMIAAQQAAICAMITATVVATTSNS